MQGILWNEMVNEYRLARGSIKGKSFVMLEGKTDRALWTEYMPTNHCYLVYADGKDDIVDALKIPVLRGISGIAGIVDADYWLITDADELDIENLLYDDCCPDMESILLSSPALKKVFRHTFDDIEIGEIHDFTDELTQESLRLAMEFGYFRWLNDCQDHGLPCNSIRFDEVIDNATLQLDCQWVAKRLAEASNAITSEQLLNEVAELRAECLPETIQLCRGKDILAIMAFILPRLYESRFGDALPVNTHSLLRDGQLAKELRKAYEYIYFQETSLFDCIRAWESTNSPYKILKTAT
ncbi:MAG: DUF4435 domain-containing protein [Chloroflexi bacterium]|nr:DUF4435 domain-containing protein [Chloroflexota bacterium]